MKNRSFANVKDGAGESSKVQPWGQRAVAVRPGILWLVAADCGLLQAGYSLLWLAAAGRQLSGHGSEHLGGRCCWSWL
jgi:hypothetical protein